MTEIHNNTGSQAAKPVFWPNPASAVEVFFMDYNSPGEFHEAYQPDMKIIWDNERFEKNEKSKVKVQMSRSNIYFF